MSPSTPIKLVPRLAKPILKPISAYFRARTQRRGPDATAAMVPGSLMVFAPHPDDDVLGCGVLIMRKLEAGIAVHVVIATDGARSHGEDLIQPQRLAALRREEAIEAARRLGLTEHDVTFLDHSDGALRESQPRLEREIQALLSEHNPEVVVVSSLHDAHPDHQALSRAARAVISGSGFTRSLYEYPVWYWTRLPWKNRPVGLLDALWYFFRDPIVDLFGQGPHRVRTEGYLDRKRAALEAHESQVRSFPPGSDADPLLPPDFLEHFFQSYEVYFPIALTDIEGTPSGDRLGASTADVLT